MRKFDSIKSEFGASDAIYARRDIDLHTHSCFCDGLNSPEQMVPAALRQDMSCIGIVAHSYVDFDRECCIEREKIPEFIDRMSSLKKEYSGAIDVLCGLEQDYYTTYAGDGYDYKIGSVHYLKRGEKYLPIDLSAEDFISIAKDYFGGDFYSLCEEYYSLVGNVIEKTGADIVAHIDLVTKFNEGDALFDTKNERYINAWMGAVDKLIPSGALFEINLGAISRGYRSSPYPAADIYSYIKSKGGKFILSSDAHTKSSIGFEGFRPENIYGKV